MQHKSLHPILPLAGLALSLFASPCYSNIGISVGSGYGIMNIVPIRVAASWDFGPVWRQDRTWGLVSIWETSANYWNGDHGPNGSNDHLSVFTTGPVFRWHRLQPWSIGIMPYVEGGIALSWLSHHEIGGRKLSINFQFQDHVGIGFRFGSHYQYDLTYRLMHYSNASMKRPNSGVNMMMLNFGIWFY